jgi:hypothetical protein
MIELVQPLLDKSDGSKEQVEEAMSFGALCRNTASNGRFPALRRALTTSLGFAPARPSSRPFSNCADRQPSCSRHRGDSAVAQCASLSTSPQPTRSLAHGRLQQAPLLTNQVFRVHRERRSRRLDPVDPQSTATRSTRPFPGP